MTRHQRNCVSLRVGLYGCKPLHPTNFGRDLHRQLCLEPSGFGPASQSDGAENVQPTFRYDGISLNELMAEVSAKVGRMEWLATIETDLTGDAIMLMTGHG
ncbi:hypothetical protein TTRE_0000338901 [Trichuris trichiura]|uniref:Uncharacterized protein n=1 Tax=Trichuris trichiura TaxID=36087 RepID=A0A077Z652_TRITR|nr:hypothetical protein TTRE_0000338901 [Trichuris trichiura]